MISKTKTIHYLELDDDELFNLKGMVVMARRLSVNRTAKYPDELKDTFDNATEWIKKLPENVHLQHVFEIELQHDIDGKEIKKT